MISSAKVLATWRSASRSVWTYCFTVLAALRFEPVRDRCQWVPATSKEVVSGYASRSATPRGVDVS